MPQYQTTSAIVLSSVKYGESSRVLKCYTSAFGFQSYMVNSLNGKRSAIKAGMILPLTQLDLVVTHKGKGTLERIKEAKLAYAYQQLHLDPVRNAMALFMAEVLLKSLKEEQPNHDKFDFVQQSCTLLDLEDQLQPHFHLTFLMGLARYLGFYPDVSSAARGERFDMMEGRFVLNTTLHPHCMGTESTKALKVLLNARINDKHVHLPKQIRRELLHDMLAYYRIHVEEFGRLKSLEILEELFAA